MAIIQSGASTDLWTIDTGSNAGRVTLYDSLGNELAGVGTVQLLNEILDALNEEGVLNLSGQANTSIQLFGSTGTFVVSFQATIDMVNWFSVLGKPLTPGSDVSTASGDGIWFVDTSGYKKIRVRVTSYTSGSTSLSMVADPEQRDVFSANFMVTGSGADNTTNSTSKVPVLVGRANVSAPTWTDGYMVPLSVDTAGALRVTGTISATNPSVSTNASSPPSSATYIGGSVTTSVPSYTNGTMNALSLTTSGLLRIDGSSVTQPISAASLPLPTGAATETTLTGVLTTTAFQARINTLGQKTMANSTPVVLASDQTVIPVGDNGGSLTIDGTVTANIGTTNGLALDATLTGGSQTTRITDGTNTATVKAASTPAVAADKALVVTLSPNNPVVSNADGYVTTAAPTYVNNTFNSLSLTTSGALRIDGSAVTQPVSGTVTANIGTTNGLALDATLTAQSIVDNAAFTDGATRIQPAGFIFDEVAGTALTENDAASARIDSKRAQIGVIEDGTTRGVRNTIKAASTAAVASDTALVVAISPNNTLVTSNAAVSATGASPPASATYMGGSVTTAAPTYTTGTMNALSLTTTGLLRIDGSGVTQPISAASLPLPTGAATETTLTGVLTTTAFQARINTLGQKTMANSTPVVLASDQSAIPITDNAGSLTVDNPILSVVGGGAEATALRVTIASDSTGVLSVDDNGGSLTVDGTVTANIGTTNGLALDTTLSAQSIVDNAAFTDGTTRIQPAGFIFDEVAGTALTENDAASARIDSKRAQVITIEDATTRGQRLTITASNAMKVDGSAVTQPVSGTITANAGTGNFNVVGTGTDNTTNSTAKLPVLPARANTAAPAWTDGNMVPLSTDTAGALRVTGSLTVSKSSTSAITSVAGSTSNTSILASNTSRISATVYNATNKTMYLAMSSTASTSSYSVQISADAYWELPVDYTGAISAVWASGVSGNALVTELT
jgi:hypothetical protein